MKIKDFNKLEESGDEALSFQRLSAKGRRSPRAKKDATKLTKATESLVENLTSQNSTLSSQLLLVQKLYRTAYRLLPSTQKSILDKMKADIDSLSDLEVHP